LWDDASDRVGVPYGMAINAVKPFSFGIAPIGELALLEFAINELWTC